MSEEEAWKDFTPLTDGIFQDGDVCAIGSNYMWSQPIHEEWIGLPVFQRPDTDYYFYRPKFPGAKAPSIYE